jgi:AcrR family transcriptional regulator
LEDKSSKRTQRSLATSERILDAAEELFAKHGIYGVTMREIAELANVDTALLHYYFESKRGVFDAVFTRRADVLNSERMREMDRLEAESGGNHELEAVIAAYMRPMFRLNRQGGQGWRHYCAFVGNMGSAPELAAIFAEKFDPVIRRFFALLRQAMPEASETDLYWAYHMFSGSIMVVNMANGAIEHLSNGLCHAEDFDEIEPRLVRYTSEGFRSICCRAAQMKAA